MTLVEGVSRPRAEAEANWLIVSAESALRQGFPELALRFFEDAVEAGLAEGEAWAVTLPRASALIGTGEYREAEEILSLYPNPEDPEWRLRQAYVDYFQDRQAVAKERLEGIAPSALPEVDQAWYFLLHGFVLSEAGDSSSANTSFREAERLAPTATLRAQFEVLRIRRELMESPPREETLSELRTTERSMRGQRGGFEAARLLAVALVGLERQAEAVEILEQQLRAPGLTESGLRPHFLLLMGVVSGDDSGRGRLALRQLVATDTDPKMRQTALYLLARRPLRGQTEADFDQFLGELLSVGEGHYLRDQVLGIRALRWVVSGDLAAAEADAQQLLEEFPGSPLVDDINRLLAYLNWHRDPPRYRTAADFLNRARARTEVAEDRARLGLLMGDCYFRNRDFTAAADVYGDIFNELPHEQRAIAVLPWMVAEIRAGRLGRAEDILDRPDVVASLDLAERWRAEWNLIDAMRRENQLQEAFSRVRELISREGEAVSPQLQVRFRWLEARLSLDAGRAAETPALADALIADLEKAPEDVRNVIPEETEDPMIPLHEGAVPIASHVLLIKGEALYELGQMSAGAAVFSELRERYPGSGPAILSYLISARDLGGEGSLSAAQQTLRQLADQFSNSDYAPIALWETAIYAERRGTNSTFREAITILEDLVQRYPEHPLTFFARLKQADLSRKLNDFGSALMLYERMLRLYPDHPERYRVDLSRADCLLARGSVDASSVDDAALIYERIFDLSSAPDDARVEAGVKLSAAQRLRGDEDQAAQTLWMVRIRFDPATRETVQLEDQGRYWLARGTLELADAVEKTGNLRGARALYTAIIEGGFPGQALARERLDRLQ